MKKNISMKYTHFIVRLNARLYNAFTDIVKLTSLDLRRNLFQTKPQPSEIAIVSKCSSYVDILFQISKTILQFKDFSSTFKSPEFSTK